MKKANKHLTGNRKIYIGFMCWLFMLPALILYIMFQAYPIANSIFYATLDWSGMTSYANFVGLNNFKELFKDKYFFNSVINSLKCMILCVPIQLLVSLVLAYILDSVIHRFITFYRTVFFLPVITTASIVGIIMIFIFGGTGSLNRFLSLWGIKAHNWIGNADTSLFVVVAVGAWKDVGTYMIYWLAALQSVPKDVYEAAIMDGADKLETFKSVVFPIILPIGGVILMLSVISSLKVFDIIQTMTNGGPFYSTDVVATFVYRTAYSANVGLPRLGYASAAAMTFGFIVVFMGCFGNLIKNIIQKRDVR